MHSQASFLLYLSLHTCGIVCRKMQEVIEAARTSWPLIRVAVAHRVGVVPVGDASVAIAASSVHRKESLAAVAFLIDEVKAKVPIWKKEFYAAEGTSKVARDDSMKAEGCRRQDQDGEKHKCHDKKQPTVREEGSCTMIATTCAEVPVSSKDATTNDEVGVWKRNAEWTLS